MKIVLFSRRNWLGKLKWYFHILAENGNIVAQSQGYSRKVDCVTTAYSLRSKLFDARIIPEDTADG